MGAVALVVLQLATLVDVGRRLAGRRRRLLCATGEPIARSLLDLFSWNSLQIKELALEFLALQLSLHGRGAEDDVDDEVDVWQSLVRDWHHLLMKELQKRASAFPGLSQQQARVRRAQVWLAAETLEQMEPAGGALATAVSTLQSSGPNRDAQPWLEVLACYLWKYPGTAGRASAVLRKLLDVLTQCHSSCKIQDVKRCVLLCYWGVARAHGPQAGKRPWPLWDVVWEQTVKTVFLNQCVEEGHLLLQELLRQGLVCSDLSCLLCPGRPLEPAALHSLAVLLSRAGSLPHLDMPPALLDHAQDVPVKHRWRLWLLELLVPGTEEGGTQPGPSTLVPAGELLAAVCLARPAAALASAESTALACTAWQDPYPWRAKLEADLERRATAQPSLCHGEQVAAAHSKDSDSGRQQSVAVSPAAVVEIAWETALDRLSKQCSAFFESAEMLPACLYTGAMGAILLAKMCHLQAKEMEALFVSPPVKQLQSSLRDCTEKLLQELDDPSSGCSSGTSSASQQGGSAEQKHPAWLGLLGVLLSYMDGGCSGAPTSSQRRLCRWLLDALPQELGACLLSFCRGPESTAHTGASLAVQPTPTVRSSQSGIDSDDDWADENMPSCSVTPSFRGSLGSTGDVDADFGFDTEQPPSSDTAATKYSLVLPERLTREETERLASLRIGLCHFLLSRRVTGVVGSSEHTFEMLLHLLKAAEKNLTAWNIQAALLALRMLLEHVELMAEPELFSVLDALRQLMKVHYRQLDVLAALLDVAKLCVPAVNRYTADSEVKSCFQVILQAYATLLGEGILNEAVCAAFLRLLLECSQAQGQSWLQLQVDGHSASPLDFAIRFLGSPYDSVRTLAAQSMAVFLKGGDPASLDALLPHIDKHLRAEVKSEDEHLSACLVLATALANAALALGPHLGGVATVALLQAVRDSGLPATLAAKVLGCAPGEGTSRDPWSMAHLPCVVHLWLKQDLPLGELPLAALGSSSPTQFLQNHWRLVLPSAVECGDREAVKFVSDTLGRPAKQILSEVAPVVMSYVLASWDSQGVAPQSLRFLEACLSPEAVEQVLMDRTAEVLVSVLQLACNLPGHAKREVYPPCLSDSQVKATLLRLEKRCCALTGTASLMDALLRKRDGLQLVLQGLQGRGARGEEPCPLGALTHLAGLVAPSLANLKGSECYVLRTLTLQLLRRLPTQGTAVGTNERRSTCLVARALHQLYEAAVPHMYKEAGRNLPVIINALAPFVDDDNIALGWEVQALVKLLLSDLRFRMPVLCVLPLPDWDVLTSCRGPLEAVRSVVEREQPFSEVLGVFAQSLKCSLLSGCEDAYVLSALSAVLERHRTGLTGLLKEMQEKPFFSEAAATSPLHQLVAILFQQARSPNERVRAASLRCLGLLGPTELGLPALATAHWNPISGMVDNAAEACHEVAYALLFSHMERYLCHSNTKTSDVACQVLKAALATKSGLAFTNRHSSTDMEEMFAFLHPFLPSGGKARLLERPTGPSDPSSLDLWVPDGACDPATWIQNLVCTLVRCCDDQVFWALLPLCQVAADLCELLFPFVVEMLADERTHWDAVVSGVGTFLERHAESRAKDEAQSQSTISSTISSQPVSTDSLSGLVYCSRASVAVVMSAVERMVVRRKSSATTLWSGFRLKVDLLKAAQAAEFCGNHAMAVQCVELWWDWNCRQALSSGAEEEDHHGTWAPLLHWKVISSGSQQQEAVTVQSVLLSTLSGLGDPDALAGCRCLALDGQSGRTLWRHWAEQRGGPCWPTLLARADLEATGRNARLAHALKQCGLYHTLATYLNGCETPDLTELQAECAWRLADWDCRLPTHHSGDAGFQHGIFTTLSSMACHEAEGLSLGMNVCRELLSGQLSAMPQLGSSQQLNQLLAKAQMCTVLEEGVALLGCCSEEEEAAGLLTRWEQRVAQPGSRFDFSEPVSWLQGVVAGQVQGTQVRSARTTMLAHYAVQARLNQCPWLARVALKELERCAPNQAGRWLLEEARIQLAQGHCTEAQHTLWTLLKQLKEQHSQPGLDANSCDITGAYAEVLQLYGECLAESGLENSDTIAREYFGKAVELLSNHHGPEEGASLWAAHLRLARFADAQLQSIEQHLRSPEFRAQQELLQQSSRLLQGSSASAQGGSTAASREDARALRVLERQTDLDRGEAASLEAARARYLRQAVAHYLQCLRGGPEHDLRLFRLASLWVSNASMPEINALLKEGLGKLASYKFVPLIYQLAARMSRPNGSGSTFSTLLLQLIERVVREHPYQTLPVVLALCNAEKDPTEKPVSATSRAKKARTSLPAEDRVEGACFLVLWLHKGDDLCAAVLPQLERLMDAYIQLAYIEPPSTPRGQASAVVKLPRDAALLKLGRLDKIPVLTQSVEVDQNASYRNLPGILKFSDEYQLCGGINQPKVIACLGQDGRKYKQLVKGRDDLRQDAVMQQAFGLVNRLLAQEAGHQGTGRLAMRTYKVVPLSRRSGLVQWCEGTQPFSEFLLPSRTGAHQRYHPQDWTPTACRSAMQAVHKSSPEERLLAYQEICRHFHPVFRYFFFENFPEPSRWFERRRAYIYSVATGSIVGYILGLGDRHCANILVDKHSAELIHIDLGVAFEQGRILTTPETVPFRLTRDIVDGMGICGVEGTFRRCCERTMEVMRASRELLVTVVEVLLHDPLSSWTLSPKRVAALQRDAAQHPALEGGAAGAETHQHDQRNRLARRMLLRLEQKLRGVEEGAPLSVAGQVNLLIQQAVDPQNLSRLFPGWQPYV
ncbi:hypothetical protein V5799_000627 [Amblyomma americanum]|uniref:non-specific serine/threonine protein kinase n=1 Tax=Amblyomma americanum TaxID=6943 RepID=A0AAQ4D2I1_AMBAM